MPLDVSTFSTAAFEKCSPYISTNIKACGSVGACSAQALVGDDLIDAYMKTGEYRVMEHLLMADMEIKMCGTQENGLFDFLMANKVSMRKKIVPVGGDSGITDIAPFVKARQYSPINNEYWNFAGGGASGENLAVAVTSAGNVPLDVRSFPTGINIYLNSAGEGGSVSRTAWKVVSAALNGNVIDLVLAPSFSNDGATPTDGYLTRGGNNVSDYEKECQEKPAYLNKNLVPFWIKTTRWATCKSSKYDDYLKLVATNPLFREFGDVKDVEKNRQNAEEFQKSFVQDFWWGRALEHQTINEYDQLDDINTFDGSELGVGVDGDVCIGKRAEPVGVYGQLLECDRVVDLLGGTLNLRALFQAIYDIIRVRATQGNNNRIVDIFTDSVEANLINRAMIKYYATESADQNGDSTLRLNMPVQGYSTTKKADFGFLYRDYELFFPAGVTMRILTHYAFDDELQVAQDRGIGDTARRLWILDFAGIYPGIIASNSVTHETGKLAELAKFNADFACVMKTHTRMTKLNSLTFTTIVECPRGNLVLENFNDDTPDATSDAFTSGLRYPASTSTSTTGT